MEDISLEDLITLKGVGLNQYNKFQKLNISNIKELLFHIPFRYRDTSEILSIQDFKSSQEGTFQISNLEKQKYIYTKHTKYLLK